jgi:aspartyl-tRNA(Asn)/glutamyl-tRNA(Gln) amidotransferase subunit A
VDTLARHGARVTDFSVPNLAYGLGAIFVIELASSSSHHDSALKGHLQEGFEPDVRKLVELGKFITAADYLQAERFRRVLARDFAKVFDDVDVIATPTMPITAWKLTDETITVGGQDESVLTASWRLTYPFNLIGIPASSQVCGFHPNGMPIGLQLAAKPFDEATVFATARAYERLTGWNDRHPMQ